MVMKKKIVQLLERNDVQELQAYFDSLPSGKPLDVHDELVLLEHFPKAAVTSFMMRFRFSEKAEIIFVTRAPGSMRRTYINLYGLRPTTQKFVIDQNLVDVATDFVPMRRFDDVDYLLDKASPAIIRAFLFYHPLENDDQVVKLLNLENKSLFKTYVDKDRFVSENVQRLIIEERKISAFNALMFKFHRNFKKKARTLTLDQMKAKQLDNLWLSDEFQLLVLEQADRLFVSLLLRTTPLSPAAQQLMFDRHFDASWFKLHVESVYGVASYRFTLELEPQLFKLLAIHNLDDCLTEFRQRDDVSFVRLASPQTVLKYLKDYWLSDEAQVALVARGNAELIRAFIARFSPEHGMCWQAEVKLVEVASLETIKLYISFHSMCRQALDLLQQKSQEGIGFYYGHHPY